MQTDHFGPANTYLGVNYHTTTRQILGTTIGEENFYSNLKSYVKLAFFREIYRVVGFEVEAKR